MMIFIVGATDNNYEKETLMDRTTIFSDCGVQ